MRTEPGSRIGPYEVLGPLGAGGMGEVWRARDPRLGRDVAIKTLSEELARDPELLARLNREARLLASLRHPGINTIYGLEEIDGQRYLVLECVEGPTLAERLTNGPLPLMEALEVCRQIAAALEAAHESGVIHRDLKPANVKLGPGGEVKVLDFGIGKVSLPPGLAAGATQSRTLTLEATDPGVIVGTASYMSPEQALGQLVDRRTDIWSFGCVLYECLSGRQAFGGQGFAATVARVLEREPEWSALPQGTPARVLALLQQCLAKNPKERMRDIGDARLELERLIRGGDADGEAGTGAAPRTRTMSWRWAAAALLAVGVVLAVLLLDPGGLRQRLLGPSGRPSIRSLAVLPLESLTRDAGRDYFADGMTEALIAELSKIGALKVISRTSVMRYKGSRKAAPEVARELGVDALVEGSVLREGDQVRVTVQLIHGPSDAHLWAQSFDRKMTGILALYSEVARAIAGEIRITLTPQEQSRLAATRGVSPGAYEQYVIGRHHLNQRTMDGYRRASERFRAALQLDPGYAPAHAALADTYMLLGEQGGLRQQEARALAADEIRSALELDPNLAEAHTSLGRWELHYAWNWAGAEHEFRRALELNPGSATGHQFYGRFLGFAGRFDEALAELQRARDLDPLSAPINAYVGQVQMFARQYEKAGEQFERTLEIDPHHALARHNLGELRLAQGRFDDAVRELERSVEISGPQATSHYLAMLGCAYARAKRRPDVNRILEELNRRRERDLVSEFDMASLYASLGETERAIEWLEQGVEKRDPWLIEVNAWPWFDALREDPRFQHLLRRVGFSTGPAASG